MSQAKVTYQSSPVCFILFLVFMILKLCDVITWSWWWVTAPLWIPVAILIVIFIIIVGIALVVNAGRG